MRQAKEVTKVDREVQDAMEKEIKDDIKDLEQSSNMHECQADLIVKTTPEELQGPSKEKAVVLVGSQGATAINVPHIDFVFRDQWFDIRNHGLVVLILYSIIRSSNEPKYVQ